MHELCTVDLNQATYEYYYLCKACSRMEDGKQILLSLQSSFNNGGWKINITIFAKLVQEWRMEKTILQDQGQTENIGFPGITHV